MAKIIALYLPQFHPIPENNEWWGDGFTEWVNVAKAKPLFPGHNQPNIPGELGFYDLRLPEVRTAQAKLAAEYGIDGFCYWHYWFGNGKRLLEMPFNDVLKSKEPDFPFCLAWANHSWYKKDWGGKGNNKLLIEQLYPGVSDYEKHFYSLLDAFLDPRYIRVDDKILFTIYAPLETLEIEKFISTWRHLAHKNGLGDFYFVGRTANNRKKNEILSVGFDAIYNDDVFNIHHELPLVIKLYYWMMRNIFSFPTVFSYKKAVKHMVNEKDKPINSIPVIAPNWDHSPRSKAKGIILKNSKPEYFNKLVIKALDIVKDKPMENQLIILKSWNEWGEGNYIEPDIKNGRAFLEALRNGIDSFYAKNENKTN